MKITKFKKGDEVKVTIGRDKGKTGKIEKVLPREGKIIVGGINLSRRHTKQQAAGKSGGIIDVIKPIYLSKVALICPKCKKLTRVGWKSVYSKDIEKKGKLRICRKCKGEI